MHTEVEAGLVSTNVDLRMLLGEEVRVFILILVHVLLGVLVDDSTALGNSSCGKLLQDSV